jgi:phosphohistidine swiveling domain-containing protein
MTTIEYVCDDGTPFPVEFERPEDVGARWRLEREHARDPFTPMGEAMGRLGFPGGRRAYGEAGLPFPSGFRAGPRAFGFAYFAEEFLSPDDLAAMFAGCSALVQTHGSALGVWHELCMPRSQEAVAFLDRADGSVPLSKLAEEQHYGQQMTMIPAFVGGNDMQLLSAACQDLFGAQAELVANELAQGYDNETIRADQELWLVGRLALDHAEVISALHGLDPVTAMSELRRAGRDGAFFDALDAFLGEFGARAEAWDIACPTWSEQRAGLWAQLGQMASADAPEPFAALRRAAERRMALAADITAKLSHDPDKRDRFQRRYERAAPYVAVREERAHWQLALTGALRGAVLRRGATLRDRGAIERADDVFYLQPEEVEGVAADLRAAVSERRAAHEHWKTCAPPMAIGGGSSNAAAGASLPADGVVRGTGVSRGVVVGVARVILDLVDADRLEPGNVLVCVMTSPPWTPLFALAGAVVADTGDMGSHPAIAAREYGVPCVLGTGNGTRAIPDGATVTVDGDNGTVTVA